MANPSITRVVRALTEGEVLEADLGGDRWLCSWHGPAVVPAGTPHGAAAICVTATGDIVLISHDGERWDAPGGRPESGETLDETMRREVMEEACAQVVRSRLLGFSKGHCVQGREAGLTLVRSLWRADVDVLEWLPRFETKGRRIEPPERARDILYAANPNITPLLCRWFEAAGFA